MEVNCCECGSDFNLTKRNEEKLLFRQYNDESEYICPQCHDERLDSEFRIHDGHYMCIAENCVRNRIALSNYCEFCSQKYDF